MNDLRYAMIIDGLVVNIAVWDGVTPWNPGDEYELVECPPYVGIGWRYVEGEWISPPPPIDPEE